MNSKFRTFNILSPFSQRLLNKKIGNASMCVAIVFLSALTFDSMPKYRIHELNDKDVALAGLFLSKLDNLASAMSRADH